MLVVDLEASFLRSAFIVVPLSLISFLRPLEVAM
jgi:hypothetical protein